MWLIQYLILLEKNFTTYFDVIFFKHPIETLVNQTLD